ncbi:MAG: rhomboid family intramembrane serine protease [bacterium]|nr:rhomboid family intramembrane serine protease [bacterium]
MLLPIKDNQPTVRFPHLTVGLIFINTAIFLYSQTMGVKGYTAFIYDFGFVPFLFFDGGATYAVEPWLYATPLTYMFLHGGWMHLIGNMLFLWIYGNNIEDYFGPIRYFMFYIVSGLAAVALHTLFGPGSQSPLVGASGAIAGVMGAYMVLHPRAEITCLLFLGFIWFFRLPAKIVLGYFFAMQIFNIMLGGPTGGGTAWLAHLGGFIFGYLLMKLLVKVRGRRSMVAGDENRVYRMHW